MDKEKIKQFITSQRENGVPDEQIHSFLVKKGAIAIPKAPEVAESNTGLDEAPFQANEDENILSGTAKLLGNAPKSAFELGKNVVSAVAHPIKTAKAVADVVGGAGAKIGEKFLEDTDFGQSLLKKAQERGLPIQTDANGKLQASNTPELEKFNAITKFFGDRYGSVDKFKETAIEDPAGVFADIASVVSGGGAVLKTAGTVSKVADVASAGAKIAEVGNMAEPFSVASKIVGKINNKVKNSPVGKVVSDISPTSYKVQQGQVAKALELTTGDLGNIKKSTGNDVTEFIVNKNLFRNTPEEISQALNETRQTTMAEVRGEIARVKKIYSGSDVPNVKKGLEVILKGVDNVDGLEGVAEEIRSLSNKTQLSLSDVQRAKELIDQNSDIYSKIGDVKSASQARGLDNIRKDLRKFIEDEVDVNTGGQVDIRQLNNDVSTTKAIEDAINNRATRGMSRQHLNAFDLMVGLGGATAFSPIVGLGLVVGKKIAESPAFRLQFAKLLQKKPIAFIEKVVKEFQENNLSDGTRKTIQELIKQSKEKSQFIESGSNALSEDK